MVPRLLRKALYLVSAASRSFFIWGSCCSRKLNDFSACAAFRFTFCCTYSAPISFNTAVVSAGSLPSSVTPITPEARPRSKMPMRACTSSMAASRELRDTVNSVPGRPLSASMCIVQRAAAWQHEMLRRAHGPGEGRAGNLVERV